MTLAPSDRFTIGFNKEAVVIIAKIMNNSHFRTVPDVVRAAIAVFADLLEAEEQGMRVVLRNEDRQEWKYSPHNPGKALPLTPDDPTKIVPFRLATSYGEPVDARTEVDEKSRSDRVAIGRRRSQ